VIAPTYSKVSPIKEMQDKMIPKDSLRMLDCSNIDMILGVEEVKLKL